MSGRSSARSTVYERLQQEILDGAFESGEPLVETALAERFGVSRTPVREALHRLQQDGIVERGERGLRVARRSTEQIFEVYEARIVLEGMICEAAAQRRSEFDVLRLRNVLAAAPRGTVEPAELMAANHEFHQAIWKASHNATLTDLLERLEVHLRRYPADAFTEPGYWDRALEEHAALVDAIEARDGTLAHRLGCDHLAHSRDVRLRAWQERAARPSGIVTSP
ncbi:MAG: GntR family transcriptional regulator [Patulibacter sp.]|nr:GntR family transcriptional regulator [Patulibacter sp.]